MNSLTTSFDKGPKQEKCLHPPSTALPTSSVLAPLNQRLLKFWGKTEMLYEISDRLQ